MKKREEWIDLVRALAMFLVVIGHVYTQGSALYFTITGPIKMPLFYIVSGYFLGVDKKFGKFVQDLICRLFIPWIVFGFCPRFVIELISGGIDSAFNLTIEFLLGQTVWYIPSFFITQLLVYGVYKLCKKKDIPVILCGMVLFAMGILLRDVYLFDLWAANTAMTGALFVIVGKFLNKYSEKWSPVVAKSYVLAVLLVCYGALIGISVWLYPEASMDFHNVSYYNVLICIALIAVGMMLCIGIAKKIPSCKLSHWICVFGQNTLVVYLLHAVIANRLKPLARHFVSTKSFAVCVLIALISCFIATVISVLCGKYCPILIGMKKKKE